jgi:sugar phosphate isomerase/epimerase
MRESNKMKLGVVSAIYDGWSFEEMIDHIAENGGVCAEVACWPSGKAERRYAGVSHIDVNNRTGEYISYIKTYAADKGVEISSLAFYPNTMDGDTEKRNANIEHLKKVIEMSALLDVNMVTTFVGRDQNKSVEENIELFREIWPPIVKFAENLGVKIAIENCPMLFTRDQWPGGQNLFTTPSIWRKCFEIIDSDYFGINYDPSHFIWQNIDYIKPLYEFKDKIFHVHFKDIKVYRDRLNEVGVMAYPLDYMSPKLPGLGDVDWGKYVSALTDIGYDSFACVEVEDKAFESSKERILDSVTLSLRYMRQFVI